MNMWCFKMQQIHLKTKSKEDEKCLVEILSELDKKIRQYSSYINCQDNHSTNIMDNIYEIPSHGAIHLCYNKKGKNTIRHTSTRSNSALAMNFQLAATIMFLGFDETLPMYRIFKAEIDEMVEEYVTL